MCIKYLPETFTVWHRIINFKLFKMATKIYSRLQARCSRQRVSRKYGVLYSFTKLTYWILSFDKVAALQPATNLNRRPRHRCFLANFVKFLTTYILKSHCQRLLLLLIETNIVEGSKLQKCLQHSLPKSLKNVIFPKSLDNSFIFYSASFLWSQQVITFFHLLLYPTTNFGSPSRI